MKISVSGLIETSGIACKYRPDNIGDSPTPHPAKVAFVTGQNIQALRGSSTPTSGREDDQLEVTYGSVVAVYRDEGTEVQAKVFRPGVAAPFLLTIGSRDIPFTGTDMLRAREEMVKETKAGATLNGPQMLTLTALQDIFEMVCSAPDEERFPASLIAQSYHAFMIDHFGDFEISVTEEEFVRKARADLIRARIGLLDPGHKDAIGTSRQLRQILADAGIEVSLDGIGAEIRSPAAMRINEEAIRRTILSNEKMTQEVFGSLTRTPVERLSAAMISLDDVELLKEKKADCRLTGTWIDKASSLARKTTQGGSSKYHFSMDVFTEHGRDILVVDDTVGRREGVAFVYSWPSGERFPVMDIEGDRVMNISKEEIPTKEELSRLSAVLEQIEALGIHDPSGDEGGHTKSRFDQ